MLDAYFAYFGTKPNTLYHSPLEPNDHPEIDDSHLLDQHAIQQHQSIIGALQWAVSLGRMRMNTAVMTMSSFRFEPSEGHME